MATALADVETASAVSLKGEEAAAAATSADFYAQMNAAKVAPLWDRFNKLTPPEPTATDKGTIWHWSELRAIADRATRDISMEHAERRALMLINPAFGGNIVSTTGLYGAVQILMPGEVARPHRHTASAFRFVIEGHGGLTTVNGKPCPMNEGDLILTPNWAWHEHSNPGTERVCWFDGLDVPLTYFFNTWFGEHGAPGDDDLMNEAMLPDAAHAQAGLRPVTGLPKPIYSSRIRYAWEDVLATFAAMPAGSDGSKLLRYTDPATGAPVTPTMDLYALALGRGETRAKRATHNTVCVVGRGSGTSRVGDTTITWAKGDVFTVPHWTWVTHHADGDDAVLFQSTDRELINRLGWLREEQAA